MFKFTKSNIFTPEWVLLIIIPSTQFKIKKNDFEGTHLFITAVHYRMLRLTSGDQDLRPVQTCSPEGCPHPQQTSADIWWLATEAHMVGERAVCIPLECFFVFNIFAHCCSHPIQKKNYPIKYFQDSLYISENKKNCTLTWTHILPCSYFLHQI